MNLIYKHGRLHEFAHPTEGLEITDQANLDFYQANKDNPLIYFDEADQTIKLREIPIDQLKAEKSNELQQSFDESMTTSQTVNSKTITITINNEFRQNLNDILRHFSKGTFTDYPFVNDDGSVVILSNLEFDELDDLLMSHVNSMRTNLMQKQAALQAATTKEEIEAIEF